MKLTKNLISRDAALAVSPEYVAFVEGDFSRNLWDTVYAAFTQLKRGQTVITYIDGQFVRAKVSSINHKSPLAIDGPIVRVSNGDGSWRVDGDRYAFPTGR